MGAAEIGLDDNKSVATLMSWPEGSLMYVTHMQIMQIVNRVAFQKKRT